MEVEYRALKNTNIQTQVVFFGKESCLPNHYFSGNNIRKNFVIHYITKGKGNFSAAGRPAVQLKAGDLFILPKNVPCFYKADSQDPWTYFWIGLSGLQINDMLSNSVLGKDYYLKQIENSNFLKSLTQLFQAVHNSSSFTNDLLITSLIYQTFYHLDTEYPVKNNMKRIEHSHHIDTAVNYLKDNYTDHNCSVISLCHKLNISRSYLYNLFKKEFDISPQKYLFNIRMEDAQYKLKHTQNTIQQISKSVGYVDEFTFSKAFKRHTGFSPKAYRQANNKD